MNEMIYVIDLGLKSSWVLSRQNTFQHAIRSLLEDSRWLRQYLMTTE